MKFLTFDTETTGLPRDRRGRIEDSSNWPYILQLSWILYDNETNRLFKSNDIIELPDSVEISKESIAVHGITRKRSRDDGIPIRKAIVKLQKAMADANVIIAHNLEFDKKLVMAECARNKMRHGFYNNKGYYCTMKNSVDLCKIEATNATTGEKYFRYPRLSYLHEFLFGTTPMGTHDALVDILVCFRCYYKIVYDTDIASRNRQIGALMTKMCKI
jgi:DNA polymerase III epsilon subunit-like protein